MKNELVRRIGMPELPWASIESPLDLVANLNASHPLIFLTKLSCLSSYVLFIYKPLDHLQAKIGGVSPTELRDTCEKGLLLITVTIPEMEVY